MTVTLANGVHFGRGLAGVNLIGTSAGTSFVHDTIVGFLGKACRRGSLMSGSAGFTDPEASETEEWAESLEGPFASGRIGRVVA